MSSGEPAVAASLVYAVAGEDREAPALARGLRWAGSALMALFDSGSALAMTDVVIRLVHDGSVVRRIQPDDHDDVTTTLALALRDLETLDAVDFADAWLD